MQLHREKESRRSERETQIKKRERLKANDAVLNKKDGKLRDLQSLITIMQTTSRHRN